MSTCEQTTSLLSSATASTPPRMGRVLAVIGALAAQTCTYELEATQVTLRIYAAPEIKAQLAMLQVRVQAERAPPGMPTVASFDAAALDEWPVDLQLVPPRHENDAADPFEAIVEVQDRAGSTIVQQRVRSAYVPYEKRVLEVWLRRCGDQPLGTLCESDPSCLGAACQTCVDGACAPTPFTEASELLDPAAILDPNKDPPDWSDPTATGLMDAGPPLLDANLADAQGDTAPDASGASGDTPSGDGGCNGAASWLPVVAHGRVPPGARSFAELEIKGEGKRLQYICRAPALDRVDAPGKVNAFPDGGRFDYGCYYGFFDREMERWVARGADQEGASFHVFAPPASCKLDWVRAGFNHLPPANALMMTKDLRGWPVFACRIAVDDALTKGTHIGRVAIGTGGFDRCVVQYFDRPPILQEQFEVLVQSAPPLK